MTAPGGAIENELRWIYSIELQDSSVFVLQETEVASLEWKKLTDFALETSTDTYVPHGQAYFTMVISAIELRASVVENGAP